MILADETRQARKSQAERHRLPTCCFSSPQESGGLQRQGFLARLDAIPLDEQVMFELQRHRFVQTRKWVPEEQFHHRFPLGAQVNRYESTVAFVFTKGSVFQQPTTALCLSGDWNTLFNEYGRCMRALWSYGEKMQARYGKEQVLYRGMGADWQEFRQMYRQGEVVEWRAFTSTSTDAEMALRFARGEYSPSGGNPYPKMPVLFVIRTATRGAPLMDWSAYPEENEVLLLPFQRFLVQEVTVEQDVLIISLATVEPLGRLQVFEVMCRPALGYRYSRDLHDRDGKPAGRDFQEQVIGCEEGVNWIVVDVPGLGDRFLPKSIDGDQKLRYLGELPNQAVFVSGQPATDSEDEFGDHRPPPCVVM